MSNKSTLIEYRVWASMKQRCLNKNNIRYQKYGGRGISICKRWLSFTNFFEDMGFRPSKYHSIDRINNDGNYEPNNCRWATRSEQQKNKGKINTENLCRGDNHWTRKNPEKARLIGRKNIKLAHFSGEKNNNSKLTKQIANEIRELYKNSISMNVKTFYNKYKNKYGVGRETIRKIIRGIAWL